MKTLQLSEKQYSLLTNLTEEEKKMYGEEGKGTLINKFLEQPDGSFLSEVPPPSTGRFLKMTLTKKVVSEMLEDGRAFLID